MSSEDRGLDALLSSLQSSGRLDLLRVHSSIGIGRPIQKYQQANV